MPDIRLKRSTGSNPPASLGPGEPAWVDGSNTLYIGKTGGGIKAIAGDGAGYVLSSRLWVNAADFGAKGDLVTSHIDYQSERYVSGADDTAALQAALNFAGSLVSSDVTKEYEGNVVCYVPPGATGKYRITAQLVIPPNVVFHCEGFIFNFLSDPHQAMIKGDRHSHCRKLQCHANAKSGIEWGRPGSDPCASNLESIVVWHVGVDFNPAEPTDRQKCGLRLFGLDFRIGHVWIKGGNMGIHGSGSSDVLAANLFLIGCANGLVINSAEQWSCPSICIDTNITNGIIIDNSNNIELKARAFVNSDAYGTAMQYGVVVGRYTGAKLNSNIEIEFAGQSTGGYGLEIGKCEAFKGKFYLTNARTYSQTSGGGTATSHWAPTATGALLAHDIGRFYFLNNGVPGESAAAAVKYTGNFAKWIDIEVILDDGIPLTEGTVYGTLRGNYPTTAVKYPSNPLDIYIACTASEAIAAGALVNFHGNGQMRNANAASALPAEGFVKTAVAAGSVGNAYTLSGLDFTPLVEGGGMLVGGSNYFLSTTPGRVSANQVAPGSGFIHQRVGKPVGGTFIFRPNVEPVVRG